MMNARSFLVPFKYNQKVSYIIEFSPHNIRIYCKDYLIGRLDVVPSEDIPGKEPTVSDNVPPMIFSSPYSADDLWDNEEKCRRFQTIQHADVLYIFNERYPIKVLKRLAHNLWTLEDLNLKNGPFEAMNTSDIKFRISQQADTSLVLSASVMMFDKSFIGRLVRLHPLQDDTKPWVADEAVKIGDIRCSDHKYYRAETEGNTGADKPIHAEGVRSDGKVSWRYLHDGTGLFVFSKYISNEYMEVTPVHDWPRALLEETPCWELGLLYSGQKYPCSGAFFRNRFAFLVNTPKGPRVCLSVSGDYNNFADAELGQATAETAITVPVLSTEFHEGKWLFAGDVLFVGTGTAEFLIDTLMPSGAMASDNIKITEISKIGSKAIMPVRVGGHIFFADRFGGSLRDLMYNYYNNGYDQIDISLVGKHLFASGIVDLAYQEIPDKILWCLMNDGTLTAFTFSAEQEVAALSRHDVNGQVESLAVVADFDHKCDTLWVEVLRETRLGRVRSVEFMTSGISDLSETQKVLETARYLDGAVEVYAPQTEIISGLEHLEGQDVTLFADGAILPTRTIVNGQIKVPEKVYHLYIGLKFLSQYIPQAVYIPSESGSGIGQVQRINHVLMMLYLSGGGKIGEDAAHLTDILYRSAQAVMGEPQQLFSGNKEILFNGRTPLNGQPAVFMIENSSPLPMNILALIPYLDVA